jgi:hypothetical protein
MNLFDTHLLPNSSSSTERCFYEKKDIVIAMIAATVAFAAIIGGIIKNMKPHTINLSASCNHGLRLFFCYQLTDKQGLKGKLLPSGSFILLHRLSLFSTNTFGIPEKELMFVCTIKLVH